VGREITDLSFEEWVKYVFDHPVTEPEWHWDIDRDYWNEIKNSALTVSYLTQLFTNPVEALAAYRDAQINQGFWYLVHNACSSYIFTLQDTSVPLKDRLFCIQSIYTLFDKLFATHCTPALVHLSEDGNPLNSVCYMWWDLFPFSGVGKIEDDMASIDQMDASSKAKEYMRSGIRTKYTEDYRRVIESVQSVMVKILEIGSDACRESALHGLGHWTYYYGDTIRAEIDGWLQKQPDLRPELRKYAQRAKHGSIL
jgi:hypothetical protein